MAKLFTIKQVAGVLGKSHDTVNRWILQGKVKAERASVVVGRTTAWMIPASELERLQKKKGGKKRKK